MQPGRFAILLAGIVLSSLSVRSGYADDPFAQWTWRNPLPTGNSLRDVTYAANRFVAVGELGTFMVSPDGASWTAQSSATHESLSAIAYGQDLFVAVGANGTVITSRDAQSWQLTSSGVIANLIDVAFGNGRFVAIGENQTILTSTDGLVWVRVSVPPRAETLRGVAFGAGRFIILLSENWVFTSVDGLTWSLVRVRDESCTICVRFTHHLSIHFANGRFLISSLVRDASGTVLGPRVFSSADGADWSWSMASVPYAFLRFLSGGGLILGVGGSNLQLSTDGQSWTNISIPTFPSLGLAGAFGNGTYVEVGSAGTVGSASDISYWTNHLYGSRSGLTGIAVEGNISVAVGYEGVLVSTNNSRFFPVLAAQNPLLGVTHGAGNFVAVGASTIFKSPDGINWTARPSGTPHNLYAVTHGPRGFVAVGDDGAIHTSSTGQIWTGQFSPVRYDLLGVVFDHGLYVAAGAFGTILTSSNAIDWQVQDSGTLVDLFAVAGGSAGFVAVGDYGTILTSSNGLDWVNRLSAGIGTFRTVSFGNGFYVAAGLDESRPILFSSIGGVSWVQQHSPAFATALGSAFDGSNFLLAGYNGTILQSQSTTTPMLAARATAGNLCEITIAGGSPGSTYTLQRSSRLGMPWDDLITFTNSGSSTCYTDTSPQRGGTSLYRVAQKP